MTKQVQDIGTDGHTGTFPDAAGAPAEIVSKVILPEGLTLETFNAAVDAISRWEDGYGELEDLVIGLYRLMNSGGRATA